ncbi:hypothetical protein MtrunA17_Chr5g0410761 [Medicago truncatula]|uniref:Nodule Cysteine-Rich (NCR) secreted peptide n=1 Tax=Medicago truncatula TaxID=3880 RepID=G7KCE2_MEDTR|nr:hypothetical protein MTR_5g029510 [Medicago truncatula]RHN54796.1 hypothetical protein MtrunA17_Chr5g0410761 [Medicago truncatula]
MTKCSALIFLLVLLICITGKPASVEARGPFECPHMVDCIKVCQGYPYCCVKGFCICKTCPPSLNDLSIIQPNSHLN